MRKMLLMSAALLSLAAVPAFAQGGTSATQTPPAPNAGSHMPEPVNSLPPGAATATGNRAGDVIDRDRTTPRRAMTGVRPMRGQRDETMAQGADGGQMPMHRARRSDRMHHKGGAHARSNSEYQGGESAPQSSRASNIVSGDTRSEIAPRLPAPDAASNTPQALLAAAQRALAAGQTGRAQEALERAETRVLTRSTVASAADTPDSTPMVQQISEARRALGRRDIAGARQAINMAMSAGPGAGSGSGNGMPMQPGMGGGMPMRSGADGGMPMQPGMGGMPMQPGMGGMPMQPGMGGMPMRSGTGGPATGAPASGTGR